MSVIAVALWSYHAESSGVLERLQRRVATLTQPLLASRRSSSASASPRHRTALARRPSTPRPAPRLASSGGRRVAVRRRLGSPRPATSAVAYRKVIAAGVPMHLVQVDLRRPGVRVAVATARYGIGHLDGWPAIIDRTRPAAAITGTYFDLKSALPVGSIIVGGRSIHRGLVGTAVAFAPARDARMVACRPGSTHDWSPSETVLRAGPRLLTGGRRTLWPSGEGFRDPAIFARKRRTAVAITPHGKLLLVAVEKPVLLRTLARALQRIGAIDAMCLDGGTSAALYHRGKTWVKPNRPLTNLLVVYDSTARYHERASLLIPRTTEVVAAPATRLPG